MSIMNVWRGLRWISASNMTLWQHFYSTSEPEFPNYSEANLAVVTEWGCTYMALRQHTNGSKTLYISNVHVLGSGLRWISASNMMLWHHFHSTSEPEFSNLGPIWPVEWYQGAPIWPWDSMPMAKTLGIHLIWMYYKVRWGGLRRISASTIMLWHHFHSTRSEPEFPNPWPTWQAGGMI